MGFSILLRKLNYNTSYKQLKKIKMKKVFTLLAIALFTISAQAQETKPAPKKETAKKESCCKKTAKDKKACCAKK